MRGSALGCTMSAVVVIASIVVILVSLVALVLITWLRLDARLDGATGLLRVRWTLISVSLDARASSFEVRLLGWRILRRSIGEMIATGMKKKDRPRKPEPQRPRRVRRADLASSLRFYRRQAGYLLRRVHVDRCDGRLRIASPDPAMTGIVYGAACGVVMPLSACWPKASLALEPDFVGELPGGWLVVAVRVRLATLARVGWNVFTFERSQTVIDRRATGKGRNHHGTERTVGRHRGAGAPHGADREHRR
jgi:hypothetical protein